MFEKVIEKFILRDTSEYNPWYCCHLSISSVVFIWCNYQGFLNVISLFSKVRFRYLWLHLPVFYCKMKPHKIKKNVLRRKTCCCIVKLSRIWASNYFGKRKDYIVFLFLCNRKRNQTLKSVRAFEADFMCIYILKPIIILYRYVVSLKGNRNNNRTAYNKVEHNNFILF